MAGVTLRRSVVIRAPVVTFIVAAALPLAFPLPP